MDPLVQATWLAVTLMVGRAAPDLPRERAVEYSYHIARASMEESVDPALVVSIIWHESDFRNLPRNRTNDYGVMQVHWSPGAPWLEGLTRRDLMDPATNIRAGVRELAAWRAHHLRSGARSPRWWGHYRWGVRVKSGRYGVRVQRRMEHVTSEM